MKHTLQVTGHSLGKFLVIWGYIGSRHRIVWLALSSELRAIMVAMSELLFVRLRWSNEFDSRRNSTSAIAPDDDIVVEPGGEE